MTGNNLVLKLNEHVESFLTIWVKRMFDAGYLEDTTAKREDCIQSFRGFLDPVFSYLNTNEELPGFNDLLQNRENWVQALVGFARSHRSRGISAEMFLGCFKTLIHSLEELILEMSDTADKKLHAINMLRRWSDGAETLILSDWETMGQPEALDRLAETNRKLTLEKNKYENILEATSDLVLVTNPEGKIIETNTAAKKILKDRAVPDKPLGESLGLETWSMDKLLNRYPVHRQHEIMLNNQSSVYNLRIIPLQSVSLASRGYMIVLSDISLLVGQRELLRKEVTERTTALADSERQFVSLFQNAGESILLLNEQFKLIESNQRSTQVFGRSHEEMMELHLGDLLYEDKGGDPLLAFRELKKDQSWEGELLGKRSNGRPFPMAVAINRIDLETGSVIQILAKDITRQKELEKKLHHEKNQLQEMNITLRNVLKSINDKNQEYQQEISQVIRGNIIPALNKISEQSNIEMRKGYLGIIKDQLLKLSDGIDTESNIDLLKLSPSELKVCQFVQAGVATKEIAETLGLSIDTIQTHRKNIRKKLGLQGRDVNLFTYLNASANTSLDQVDSL
ncbi:MAG: PAS domain S-box protein [Proteobacteria bacterium]|nr:PAS domain S-box protein [Pseudomonadota bacterium]